MGDSEEKRNMESSQAVPPFVQIVTAASNAFGRGEEDMLVTEVLYGLDREGRVWQWMYADPEREGAAEGWRLLPASTYKEGVEMASKRKTR